MHICILFTYSIVSSVDPSRCIVPIPAAPAGLGTVGFHTPTGDWTVCYIYIYI